MKSTDKIYGTGVDITEVGRLKKAVAKWGDLFLNKIFTNNELENAKKRVRLYEHLAGRFAAKEAIFKAVGDFKLGFQDIEVLNDQEGKPYCKLLNDKAFNKHVMISISHVKNYALAQAIAFEKK